MGQEKKLKVLWAVDAFDDSPGARKRETQVLAGLGRKATLEVYPVFVLSPSEVGVTAEVSGVWAETYGPLAKKALDVQVERTGVLALRESRVILQNRRSIRSSAGALTKLASAEGFDLILAGSHGRTGLGRMLLGSFAEALLSSADVPVLIVGQQARSWTEGPERILLPSDLLDLDSKLFNRVFDFAKTQGARVTLLHSVPRPVEQMVQSGVFLLGGGWMPGPLYLEKEYRSQKDRTRHVLNQAERQGVPCEAVVDDAALSVTESILRHAEQLEVGLIAMNAESGPVASALLGSITRQVVRSAPCPVLVYRFRNGS